MPRFADYATVEAPGGPEPVLGLAHVTPEGLAILRALRLHHPIDPDAANPALRAATGEAHLQSVFTPELRDEYATTPEAADLRAQLAPTSYMAVPLDLGGGVKGAVLVGTTDPERTGFDREDLHYLEDLVERVGVVLAATRLRREEHLIAVRLQEALLPDDVLWQPNAVVEARYSAASEVMAVGGDWYDTFEWPDGHLGVMVGDVVGHNLDSAAAMGRMRAATAAIAAHVQPSPAALLEGLDAFARSVNGTDYATAACVVLDTRSGQLRYSSAGHPPVLVVSPGGDARCLSDGGGPPFCVIPCHNREQGSTTLEPGSLVVLYTDGLIERRRESLDAGLDRLRAAARDLMNEPIEVVADGLVEAMAADLPSEDDMVLACFRYTPEAARFQMRLPARSSSLAGVRSALRDWLDDQQLMDLHHGDTLLAVSEACTHVVEHAFQGSPDGEMDVEVTNHGHHIAILVRDFGGWRFSANDNRHSGRGIRIMRNVASRFRVRTTDTGTTVTMTVPVRSRRGALLQ